MSSSERWAQWILSAIACLVVVQPGWHHGVIGIVASRLVERYGVPVFIGTYEDEEHKVIRGSARGIPEFDVFCGSANLPRPDGKVWRPPGRGGLLVFS